MVIFTCTTNTQENIIEYFGTWYGYECGRFTAMFVDLWHILNDGHFPNDVDNEFIEGEEWIIDIGRTTTTNDNEFTMGSVGRSNEDSSSNVPMERALACLGLRM
jgi:hypothetical protein